MNRKKTPARNGIHSLLREVIVEVAKTNSAITKADMMLEVVDADKELTIFPIEDDYAQAVRKDVCRCVFANASNRQTHAIASVFFQHSAYIAHLGRDGVRRWYHYSVGADLHRIIVAYDEHGKKPDMRVPFVLKPLPRSRQLIPMRRAVRDWNKSDMGKALNKRRALTSGIRQTAADIDRTKDRVTTLRERFGDSSPGVVAAKKQLTALRSDLTKKREALDTLETRVEHLREESTYNGTGPAKPRTYAEGIRNGVTSLRRAIKAIKTHKKAA